MSIGSRPVVFVLMAALGLPVATPVGAQEPAPEAAPPVTVEIRGADIEKYSVVMAFFNRAIFFRRGVWPGAYDGLLQKLGMEAGSEAAKRLDRAITEAAAVREIRTVNPELDNREEYWAFQMKALREKARALGHVYGTLVRDLRRLGDYDRGLEEYLEVEVRSGISVWTENDGPDDVSEALGSFDEEVDAVLRGANP